MDKVAADLTRILGPERLLWEREHLATYGFDGTAALLRRGRLRGLAENYRRGDPGRPLRGAEQDSSRHARIRYGFKRRQRAGTRLYRALSSP